MMWTAFLTVIGRTSGEIKPSGLETVRQFCARSGPLEDVPDLATAAYQRRRPMGSKSEVNYNTTKICQLLRFLNLALSLTSSLVILNLFRTIH